MSTSPAREPRGLSHARTSFVGRSEAVDKVAGLLTQYRLVTVTGPGGVGKTRLAGEVIRQVAGRFADGVWVAELAAVAEPAQVPAMMATVLGLHQAAGVPIADALAARLARQQLLLVLDNCEHVLDAVAEFCATVLQSADDIRILATSREQLGLPEEARYRLPPLTLPGPEEPDGPGSRAQAEAVTLFVERARQIDPDLALDGEAGAAVARLVQRLDGMPLAIELAAARVEALGLGQMLDRLDDRLLTSANRAAPARQRSLEAAVDWSYQLLTKPGQRVFRCLSVFPGPFGLDAAEAVAGTDAGPAVLHLVDCSLLAPPAAGPDGRSRYSMLQTLRGYGLRQLEQAGEEPAAAAALAAHALSMAERAVAQLARSDQELSAARWLDAEDAAVHQGLAWALDHDPPNALKLALALAPWWLVRGRWVQGYALLQRAAGQADPGGDAWCAAQVWLGRLARGASDFISVVLGHNSAVVAALKDGPPSSRLADGLVGRAAALRNLGQLDEAAAEARTALDLARRLGYAEGETRALMELSDISTYAGQGDEAVAWAVQARQVPGDRIPAWFARRVDSTLVWALVYNGELDGVPELCEQRLAAARTAGDLSEQADLLCLMAVAARKGGQLTAARAWLRESAELAVFGGYPLRMIDVLEQGGHLCAATGRPAEAVTLWSATMAQCQAAGRPGLARLSARERELVTLVAQGRTDAQIAEQLFISVRTVRTHLDRIRDKSGCRRRADLTRLALQEGII
ncbi:MAG TPA: LuxR C-terminal-related transcriptional regulator [Streptosporangiaceae bacterium]|nr:LuxR C-terminal-related transcriptional regulator [Streptosporangiaceae bacterium]